MDDVEAGRLLRDLESDRAERKASASDRDRIAEAICAYANDLPDHRRSGIIFIGANDDGSCAGLQITDKLLTDLPGLRTNGNIHPFPSMVVQRRTILGCDLVVIIVQPSDFPPVRFRGRTWVRVGATRSIATAEEERRLAEKRRFRDAPFDLTPVTDASLADLNLDLFRQTYLPGAVAPEIIEQNARSPDQQLSSLRLCTREGIPTVVGLLALGKDPRFFLPGAYVQFTRFAGPDLTADIKTEMAVSGPLPEMLRTVDDLLRANIATETDIKSSDTEVRRPDYPLVALQQIVRNAILHRSYQATNAPVRINWFDDRIEIQNPGGPFGQITVHNFGEPGLADYRNSYLADAMKILGYVQRFGVGISTARKQLADNGNPELEYIVRPEHVLAIVRKRA
jgi:ATP-dependent DNA helicase RecG